MSAEALATGIPSDLASAMRRAAADMDCIREEIRRTHGVLGIDGPAIRESRGT